MTFVWHSFGRMGTTVVNKRTKFTLESSPVRASGQTEFGILFSDRFKSLSHEQIQSQVIHHCPITFGPNQAPQSNRSIGQKWFRLPPLSQPP